MCLLQGLVDLIQQVATHLGLDLLPVVSALRSEFERQVRLIAVKFVHILVALVIVAPEVRDVLGDMIRRCVDLPLSVRSQMLPIDDSVSILQGIDDVLVKQFVTAPLTVVKVTGEAVLSNPDRTGTGPDTELDVVSNHHVEGRPVIALMIADVVRFLNFNFVLTILDGFQNKLFLCHTKKIYVRNFYTTYEPALFRQCTKKSRERPVANRVPRAGCPSRPLPASDPQLSAGSIVGLFQK